VQPAMTGPLRRPSVLVIDSESESATALSRSLQALGFDTITAECGEEGLAVASTKLFEAIVLDISLPGLDGFEVCWRLREAGTRAPVLFLTARDAVEDKIRALALGGDGYVTKPFALDEVVARIHALIRRAGSSQKTCSRVRSGCIELDRGTREVWRHGLPVQLSATEFALLEYLVEHAGRVISKAEILDAVWSYDFQGESGVVETYIFYLRRKLGDADRTLIRTVRGAGYLLETGMTGYSDSAPMKVLLRP
jgi:two-component system OmpR family response regulator